MALPTNYREEFPDFGEIDVDLSALKAAGFIDTSWHNDTCPSWACFVHGLKGASSARVQVYVDYADESKSEWPGSPRFTVQQYSADGEWIDGGDFAVGDWSDAVSYALTLVSIAKHDCSVIGQQDGTVRLYASGNDVGYFADIDTAADFVIAANPDAGKA